MVFAHRVVPETGPLIHAEHPSDATGYAADDTAYDPSNGAADRASRAFAFMGAFGRAATYALGIGCDRQGEKQSRCGGDNLDLHAISPELVLSTRARRSLGGKGVMSIGRRKERALACLF
jgi:hypothetical protein